MNALASHSVIYWLQNPCLLQLTTNQLTKIISALPYRFSHSF